MNSRSVFNHPFYLMLAFFLLFSALPSSGQSTKCEGAGFQSLKDDLVGTGRQKFEQARIQLGDCGKNGILALIEGLRSSATNPDRSDAITKTLSFQGKDAVRLLIQALDAENKRQSRNSRFIRYLCNALKSIAAESFHEESVFKLAVPILLNVIEAKKDKVAGGSNDELQDFDAAEDCLAYIGTDAAETVPHLIVLVRLEQFRGEKEGHYRTKDAIVQIIHQMIRERKFSGSDEIFTAFNQNERTFSDANDAYEIRHAVGKLYTGKKQYDRRFQIWLGKIFLEHSTIKSVVGIPLLAWLFIFFVSPISLLKIYEVFPSDARLSGFSGLLSLSAKPIFDLFILRPRVLKAWTGKHLSSVQEAFCRKQTVRDRKIHVPIGLFVDKHLIVDFQAATLQPTFAKNQARILISGAGGTGKTSLACTIAKWAMGKNTAERLHPKHPMLPVLLEEDIVESGPDALLKVITAQLSEAIDAKRPIPRELVRILLERNYVLLIVDGLSEKSGETRKIVFAGITDIPVNTVVLTSRAVEEINNLQKTIVKPNPISGNRLSSFVETYLTSLGKKELFADEEFFNGCRLLSTLVGDRNITPLLAKLFVEQMVARQEKRIVEDLPNTIPELMLQSIKTLYIPTPAEGLALRDVIKAAKIIAWRCVCTDYRPLPVEYDSALLDLAHMPNGENALLFLLNKLKIIETTSFDEKLRFKIDPLAEYLAAMHLVEENGSNEDKWRLFIDATHTRQKLSGSRLEFLMAVRECCMVENAKIQPPEFILEELTNLITQHN